MVHPTLMTLHYTVDAGLPGQVSSDPDELVALTARAIDGALKAAEKQHFHIEGVAASCYWHSLMGIDHRGHPTTELLTWADTRSAPEAARLRDDADEHDYHSRTGCFFHASFWPAKLRWLRATRPAAVRRTASWVSLGEYLYMELFRERRVSLSMASGTGLLNGHTCRWDPDALRLAGVEPNSLSALMEWDASLSRLRAPYARRWPALRDVPWFLALGDGALSNVGSGCMKSNWYCAMVGTSSALRVVIDRKDLVIPWGAWAYRLDRRRWVVGGALSEGGNVLAWIANALHLPDWKATEAAIAGLPPDGHGLTVLPFWAGERSPNWRGDTRGAITGLSLATPPADIMRAAMEAISYQFAAVFETLQASVARPRAVVASGGRLLHSPTWLQMLADVLNASVRVSAESEASSRGAALLALHNLGHLPRLWNESPEWTGTFRPRAKAHRIYVKAMQRQQALYRALFEQSAITAAAE